MKQSIIRNLSLYARTRLLSPPCYRPSSQLALSTRPRLSFFSTESQSQSQSQYPEVSNDVSDEEFKSLLNDYFKGNEEAFPRIFEAVLTRKLSGRHEQTDKQLLEELCGKKQESMSDVEEDDDEEIESDYEFYGSEEKAADLNQAMAGLMKEMPNIKKED